MTRFFSTVGMILISSVVAFSQGGFGGGAGQGRDDHDDTAPVQAGYAVVTPSSPTATGLVVLEIFGLRRGTETTQTDLRASNLVTSASMFVDVSDRLAKNLGIAIVNPNNGSANVTLTLLKSDATQIATRTITIANRRQITQYVTEMFSNSSSGSFAGSGPAPAEFTGTLVMSSSVPVSVTALKFRGANFSALPLTTASTTSEAMPTLGQGIGGIGALLLPQFVAGGGWATEIVIANTGTTSLTVRLDLFKNDGAPLPAALNGQTASSFTNLTIAAGSILVFAPRNTAGDDDF